MGLGGLGVGFEAPRNFGISKFEGGGLAGGEGGGGERGGVRVESLGA